MSDPYERVKGGRLSFKDGSLATRKSIDKKKKKKKHKKDDEFQPSAVVLVVDGSGDTNSEAGQTYTIDAAKNMKYDELFPVETKKFGYDPKTDVKTVEDALDDRVKKKADRYCK
ncbi:uncharacterized protein LOC123195418 [Mangifera indica]|uniref:uncharacterized protein LOC123195418 n=1 Tax=Mangifera indica TaxID=29780 RepID=UPI001CF9A0FF|nr:uncharacterized protein LOC123195418 [Mangifera indica]